MSIQSTCIHLDRILTGPQLEHAVGQVLRLDSGKVVAADFDRIEHVPEDWFTDEHEAGIQMETFRGDFPQSITVVVRNQPDFQAFAKSLAIELGVTVLTDEFGVEPFSDVDWMMLSPDGTTTHVLTDSEAFGAEDPAIILLPEYRPIYRAHLNATAAD